MTKNKLNKLEGIYRRSNINKGMALYYAIDLLLSEHQKNYGDDVAWIKEAFEENFRRKLDKERKDLALGYMVYWLDKKGCTNKTQAINAISEWRGQTETKVSPKTVEAAFTEVKKAVELLGEASTDKDAFLAVLPLILSDNTFPEHYEDAHKAYGLVKEEVLMLAEFFQQFKA